MSDKNRRTHCFVDIESGGNSAGRIVLELFSDVCPKTCNNFVKLCNGETIRNEFVCYKGKPFTALVNAVKVECGISSEAVREELRCRTYPNEVSVLKHFKELLLSTASRGSEADGRHWIITTASTPELDSTHLVFGRVVSGQGVVQQIHLSAAKSLETSLPIQAKIANCGELKTRVLDQRKPPALYRSALSQFRSPETSGDSSSPWSEKLFAEKQANLTLASLIKKSDKPSTVSSSLLAAGDRKIKGRGTVRYHGSSAQSRSESETPPHWRTELEKVKLFEGKLNEASGDRWIKGDKLISEELPSKKRDNHSRRLDWDSDYDENDEYANKLRSDRNWQKYDYESDRESPRRSQRTSKKHEKRHSMRGRDDSDDYSSERSRNWQRYSRSYSSDSEEEYRRQHARRSKADFSDRSDYSGHRRKPDGEKGGHYHDKQRSGSFDSLLTESEDDSGVKRAAKSDISSSGHAEIKKGSRKSKKARNKAKSHKSKTVSKPRSGSSEYNSSGTESEDLASKFKHSESTKKQDVGVKQQRISASRGVYKNKDDSSENESECKPVEVPRTTSQTKSIDSRKAPSKPSTNKNDVVNVIPSSEEEEDDVKILQPAWKRPRHGVDGSGKASIVIKIKSNEVSREAAKSSESLSKSGMKQCVDVGVSQSIDSSHVKSYHLEDSKMKEQILDRSEEGTIRSFDTDKIRGLSQLGVTKSPGKSTGVPGKAGKFDGLKKVNVKISKSKKRLGKKLKLDSNLLRDTIQAYSSELSRQSESSALSWSMSNRKSRSRSRQSRSDVRDSCSSYGSEKHRRQIRSRSSRSASSQRSPVGTYYSRSRSSESRRAEGGRRLRSYSSGSRSRGSSRTMRRKSHISLSSSSRSRSRSRSYESRSRSIRKVRVGVHRLEESRITGKDAAVVSSYPTAVPDKSKSTDNIVNAPVASMSDSPPPSRWKPGQKPWKPKTVGKSDSAQITTRKGVSVSSSATTITPSQYAVAVGASKSGALNKSKKFLRHRDSRERSSRSQSSDSRDAASSSSHRATRRRVKRSVSSQSSNSSSRIRISYRTSESRSRSVSRIRITRLSVSRNRTVSGSVSRSVGTPSSRSSSRGRVLYHESETKSVGNVGRTGTISRSICENNRMSCSRSTSRDQSRSGSASSESRSSVEPCRRQPNRGRGYKSSGTKRDDSCTDEQSLVTKKRVATSKKSDLHVADNSDLSFDSCAESKPAASSKVKRSKVKTKDQSRGFQWQPPVEPEYASSSAEDEDSKTQLSSQLTILGRRRRKIKTNDLMVGDEKVTTDKSENVVNKKKDDVATVKASSDKDVGTEQEDNYQTCKMDDLAQVDRQIPSTKERTDLSVNLIFDPLGNQCETRCDEIDGSVLKENVSTLEPDTSCPVTEMKIEASSDMDISGAEDSLLDQAHVTDNNSRLGDFAAGRDDKKDTICAESVIFSSESTSDVAAGSVEEEIEAACAKLEDVRECVDVGTENMSARHLIDTKDDDTIVHLEADDQVSDVKSQGSVPSISSQPESDEILDIGRDEKISSLDIDQDEKKSSADIGRDERSNSDIVKDEKGFDEDIGKNEKISCEDTGKDEKISSEDIGKNEEISCKDIGKNEKVSYQDISKDEKISSEDIVKNEKRSSVDISKDEQIFSVDMVKDEKRPALDVGEDKAKSSESVTSSYRPSTLQQNHQKSSPAKLLKLNLQHSRLLGKQLDFTWKSRHKLSVAGRAAVAKLDSPEDAPSSGLSLPSLPQNPDRTPNDVSEVPSTSALTLTGEKNTEQTSHQPAESPEKKPRAGRRSRRDSSKNESPRRSASSSRSSSRSSRVYISSNSEDERQASRTRRDSAESFPSRSPSSQFGKDKSVDRPSQSRSRSRSASNAYRSRSERRSLSERSKASSRAQSRTRRYRRRSSSKRGRPSLRRYKSRTRTESRSISRSHSRSRSRTRSRATGTRRHRSSRRSRTRSRSARSGTRSRSRTTRTRHSYSSHSSYYSSSYAGSRSRSRSRSRSSSSDRSYRRHRSRSSSRSYRQRRRR